MRGRWPHLLSLLWWACEHLISGTHEARKGKEKEHCPERRDRVQVEPGVIGPHYFAAYVGELEAPFKDCKPGEHVTEGTRILKGERNVEAVE